jgi:trk system potassium uptake protein
MNVKGILKVTSSFLYFLTALVAVGIFVSGYFYFTGESELSLVTAFAQTTACTLFTAIILHFFTRGSDISLESREAIISVIFIWLLGIFFCALPFTLSSALENKVDAFFETISGLTSTGATILQAKNYNAQGEEIPVYASFMEIQKVDYQFYGTVKPVIDSQTNVLLTGVEAFNKPLLFWRSWLQWIGGIGMVLLFVALRPALGSEAKKLFRFESTGPSFSPVFPKVQETAILLIGIYIGLTVLCGGLLLIAKPDLPFFDVLNISLATISTGGFSTKNASIASYNSFAIEIVVMLFMILGAINFSYYYFISRKQFKKLIDPEFLMFFVFLLGFATLVSFNIYNTTDTPLIKSQSTSAYTAPEAIRSGFFQAISTMTTTGFSTANYDLWPFFSQALLLVSMFFGGMTGSTAAGLKIIRICILWKCLTYHVQSTFKGNVVKVIRLGGKEISQEVAFAVLAFFLITVVSSLIGLLLVVADGVDLGTALGLNASMINNAGAAFRMAGPLDSCAFLSPFSKLICMIWMLLGRLEFYIWFAVLLPSFWKKR